jgi:glycerate-2-kinase
MMWDDQKARKALRRIFDAAVGRADTALIVPRDLPAPTERQMCRNRRRKGIRRQPFGYSSTGKKRRRPWSRQQKYVLWRRPGASSRCRSSDEPWAEAARHDSLYGFQAIGDLVVTGPTLANINDIRAILISGS